jgi:hypothetical protein
MILLMLVRAIIKKIGLRMRGGRLEFNQSFDRSSAPRAHIRVGILKNAA